MHFGTIICALGFRYKNYCSNLVRTMMVEPTEKMQDNYKYLLTLEEEIINLLKDGKQMSLIAYICRVLFKIGPFCKS